MTTKQILKILKDTDAYKELEIQEDEIIDGEIFRGILGTTELPFTYYCGLSEYNCDGYWNELREYKDDKVIVLDIDAPNSNSIEDWAEYLSGFWF